MRNLIFTALIALSIVSCTSNDSEIINPTTTIPKAEGVLSFTYNGAQETIYNEAVFSDKGFNLPEYKTDLSKPWFAWQEHSSYFRIYLGLGRDMNHPKTVQKRLFAFYSKKPNTNEVDNWDFYIYDSAVPLTNKKITITLNDGKYISGTFSSDKITGNFEKIRYNTLF